MSGRLPVRRALLSVSDKDGVGALAWGLAEAGVTLVSTGSTAAAIRRSGVEVTDVATVTGVPEMLGGRVKTLHPAVHAAILADRTDPEHVEQLHEQGIEPIDLVVANLYPFERTVDGGGSAEEIVEQIDIGGPTLVRGAAKNHASVAVVVSPSRYGDILHAVAEGGTAPDLRARLAAEAFAHVATYDAAIAAWFRGREGGLSASLTLGLERVATLRYGENPHQAAALYREVLTRGPLGGAEVLQGKEMSFNNWLDADAARSVAWSLEERAAVIVKHASPCGVAVADSLESAYRFALASDPISAFGGVVAFNSEVDGQTAAAMAEVFTEVVVAPGYAREALDAFAARENLRLLRAPRPGPAGPQIRPVEGGALIQEPDPGDEPTKAFTVAGRREPTAREWEDLVLAWRVAARVRSNAIVLASGRATVGIGAGQMSRVDAVDIACRKAGSRAGGAVMASDAFFPFRDGIDRAAGAGVRAVIHPGGSVRDQEVLEAADEHGMAVVLTGTRHFRH